MAESWENYKGITINIWNIVAFLQCTAAKE